MKRILTLLVVLLAIALPACGDDDDSTATDDGGSADAGDDGTDDGAADDGATDDGAGGPALGGPYPIADLSITYEHPDAGSVTYQITCLGDTATVTGGEEFAIDENAACLALAEEAVQTRLIDGPPADLVCTEQYGGPDVAAITGTIDEQVVDATVDRTNGCGISDWDDVLGAILPVPLGVTAE